MIRSHETICDKVFDAEGATLCALSIHLIRSVVAQHGGHLEKNLVTNTLDISVPVDAEATCTQQIEEQVYAMCRCMYSHVTALFADHKASRTNLN